MLSEKMEKALNDQVNAEMYSAYLYLSMSAYFGSLNLEGSSSWMKIQALEEMSHAMKLYNFIEERGGRVTLAAIEAPRFEWASSLEVFESALEHERHVTALINKLVTLAIEEHDHASNNFLQWFVAEQVEEEAAADDVVQKLKLAGKGAGAMFMLDRELGRRASGTTEEDE